ncbi:MAG: glycosyltransferase family 4 protein [Cyanobacteriota bacterium]|jgi:glycosyltransferase involved in cell wall biosynthesis
MTLLTNLLSYLPGHSGFGSYVRRVLPGIPGQRLLLDPVLGPVCREGELLPEQVSSSRWLAILQRLSLAQHGVNVPATLRRAGMTDPSAVYSPYCEVLFALPSLPQVITCHDLTPLVFPNSRKASWRYRHWIPCHLHRASRVIAISGFVADQLIEAGVPASRIRIVPNGITITAGPHPSPRGSDLLLLARHDGNKNVVHVLKGFYQFLRRHPRWPGVLWVVGRPGRQSERIHATIRELALESRVNLQEGLGSKALADLLASCCALVSGSLMEGCDYPVLEAMAAGIPALVSDIPVHRELYGEAASLFSVEDAGEDLARKLADLVEDPSLWQQLSRAGNACAHRFSLQRQQSGIMEVMQEVVP